MRTMSKRLNQLINRYGVRDPVRNPQLLERLSSYASIIAKKPVTCKWGDKHQTNLDNAITLNPDDPKHGPGAERKIVIDAALEHEIRGHWRYTPRRSFEIVVDLSNGYQYEGFSIEDIKEQSQAIKPIFNILEDGRVETRLRWEAPRSYEIIALGDLIRPRWKTPELYLPAPKAYRIYLKDYLSSEKSLCPICQENPAPSQAVCESCFTKNYRWEQITGILLTSAIPPHTPPLSIVEKEVRKVFELCTPFVLYSLSGTSIDVIQSSLEIINILIKHEMIPNEPKTSHLKTNNATGHGDARDSGMSKRTKKTSGLDDSNGQEQKDVPEKDNRKSSGESQENQADSKNQAKPERSGNGNGGGDSKRPDTNIQPGKEGKDEKTGQDTTNDRSKGPNESPQSDSASNKQKEKPNSKQDSNNGSKNEPDEEQVKQATQKLEKLSEKDLQDFNYVFGLDINIAKKKAQDEINYLEGEQRENFARQLIMGVSSASAAPGIDVKIRRTKQLRDSYQILEVHNRERARRFSREIRNLMSFLMRPQKYQRIGRLDRKQLVNAVARKRDTVFIRSKASRVLDLAVSLNVDISGSMSQFNQPIIGRDLVCRTLQLVDAVSICAIGLGQLNAKLEVRAFGSYQWLAKGFYENECFGIAGIAGEDSGGTDMTPAIEYCRIALLGRQEKDKLLIIMTDGYPANQEEAAREVHLAKQVGIHVLGVLFDNYSEKRDFTDPAMAKLFGPNGFTVIHSLDQFPREVGQGIKSIIRKRTILH
jgi:hypothetical protein